jgi:DNA-3-methyladenine glycosylase I
VYVAYHDTEWGVPCHNARELWENLMLEGFQAGLSWITILRRRDAFRSAFANFDPAIVATWGEAEIQTLLANAGIIRHRGKIAATIAGAQAFLRIENDIGFARFIWDHVGGAPIQTHRAQMADVPAHIPQAHALAKSLKSQGFKFCGPTITYAFMQAMGMVNDHLTSCPRYAHLGHAPLGHAPLRKSV